MTTIPDLGPWGTLSDIIEGGINEVAAKAAAAQASADEALSRSGTSVAGSVATFADLPDDPRPGQSWIVRDEIALYTWSETLNTWGAPVPVQGSATEAAVAAAVTKPAVVTALGPAIDARTGNGQRPVGQGELVLSVRDARFSHLVTGSNWTAALQATVDAVNTAGGGTVLVPPGLYWVAADSGGSVYSDTGGIDLKDNVTLRIERGATLRALPVATTVSKVIRITGRTNVAVMGGGTIDGNRASATVTTGEWGYGIAVNGGRKITVDGVQTINCWGDGINLQKRSFTDHTPPVDVTIRNVESRGNRRQGLSIESGRNVRVEKSTFADTGGTLPSCGIDIEPPDGNGTIDHVVITDCYLSGNARAGVHVWESAGLKVHDVTIEKCHFDGNGPDGNVPQLRAMMAGRGLRILDNAFRNSPGTVALRVDGPSRACRVVGNDVDRDVYLTTNGLIGTLTRGTVVKDNTLNGGTLVVDSNMATRIVDNDITPAPGRPCIDFTGPATMVHTKVRGNFFNGGTNGIHCNESIPADHLSVVDNIFLHTTGPAIVLKGGGDVRIKENTFEGCCLTTGVAVIDDLNSGAAVRRTVVDNTFRVAPRSGTTATNVPSWGYRCAAPLQVSYVGDNVISAFGFTFAMFPPDQAASGTTVLKGGPSTVPARATAYRTVNAEPGSMFFDMTLGKPIWWTGSAWKDAAGTTV